MRRTRQVRVDDGGGLRDQTDVARAEGLRGAGGQPLRVDLEAEPHPALVPLGRVPLAGGEQQRRPGRDADGLARRAVDFPADVLAGGQGERQEHLVEGMGVRRYPAPGMDRKDGEVDAPVLRSGERPVDLATPRVRPHRHDRRPRVARTGSDLVFGFVIDVLPRQDLTVSRNRRRVRNPRGDIPFPAVIPVP